MLDNKKEVGKALCTYTMLKKQKFKKKSTNVWYLSRFFCYLCNKKSGGNPINVNLPLWSTHAELLILCNLFIGLIENSSAAYIVGSGANLFYGKYNVCEAKKWGFSARC